MTIGLAFAAQSHAAWSPPFAISDGPSAGDPVLAAASTRQDAFVVWRSGSAVAARHIAADGTRGAIRRLGTEADLAWGPSAVVDRSGALVVVWYGPDDELLVRRLGPGGKLGATRQLAPASMIGHYPYLEARAAVDQEGVVTVVWPRVITQSVEPKGFRTLSATVHARRIDADGALGPIVDLGTGGTNLAPRVAVDPSGRATIAWIQDVGSGFGVRAATLDPDGTIGPVRDVSESHRFSSGDGPELAVDAAGDATLAWISRIGQAETVVARRMTRGGVLGTAHVLAPEGYHFWQDLAVAADGRATVVWRNATSGDLVQARQVGPGDEVGPLHTLSQAPSATSDPMVAIDRRGVATTIWTETGGYRPDGSYSADVRVRRIAADGSLEAMGTLTPPTRSSQLLGPDLVAHGGMLTAAWNRSQRRGSAVEAARLVSRCPSARPRGARATLLTRRHGSRRAGLHVRLRFDRAADVRIGRAVLSYRSPGGKSRSARLRLARQGAGSVRHSVRFRLSGALRRKLQMGQSVVRLRLRARPYATGCRYGKTRVVSAAARVP